MDKKIQSILRKGPHSSTWKGYRIKGFSIPNKFGIEVPKETTSQLWEYFIRGTNLGPIYYIDSNTNRHGFVYFRFNDIKLLSLSKTKCRKIVQQICKQY